MNHYLKRAMALCLALVLVLSTASVSALAKKTETGSAPETATTAQSKNEQDLKTILKQGIYVKHKKHAGLQQNIRLTPNFALGTATLYLPGQADESRLTLSWADKGVTFQRGKETYSSGEAPVAPSGSSLRYQIRKGPLTAVLTIKTVKGSEGVKPMFLTIDESKGSILAMKYDHDHEKSCYGKVQIQEEEKDMSVRGRGNSTWLFRKKPYNITIYGDDSYQTKKKGELIDGVKSKKWTLLANYFDNSLMRNKIGQDLAEALGIGLKTEFVDVWMNGEYLGNYSLSQKKDANTPAGGYVLENDHIPDSKNPDQFKFPEMHNMPGKHNVVNIKDIGKDAKAAGETNETIQAWFERAWSTVLDYDSEDYQEYFDLDSWAKMYLMEEVSKTYDCYAGNIIMRREGLTDQDKLLAGPAWDYDVAFGRTLHKFLVWISEPMQLNAEGWYNDAIGVQAVDKPTTVLQELGKHPSFLQHVSDIYSEYLAAFQDLAPNVDRQREFLRQSAVMNNDKYGANHLGADYVVAPNTMDALCTEPYKLNYEITLTWDNYVNNLRRYCDTRVRWLTDHLYNERPAGTITQDGNVLTAALTTDTRSPAYQWQRSTDGINWAAIPGATGARYTAGTGTGPMQYRCAVTVPGVTITTSRGGTVKTTATTALTPVTLRI